VKLARLRKPKAACFPSYVDYRPNKNISNIMKTGHATGRAHTREEGKRRKLRM
jgi:hypothetical protein